MSIQNKFNAAIAKFDSANQADPNKEHYNGKDYSKELLYALRMTDQLSTFEPNASEALKLAVRCQHICRWEIDRQDYEMNRVGYLKWRHDLKIFHAKKAASILEEVGYEQDLIDEVKFLLQKKQLKKHEDTQTLEDVVCLVFLEYYFESFSKKYDKDKLVEILKKTWAKMSDKGHRAALELNLSSSSKALIAEAIS